MSVDIQGAVRLFARAAEYVERAGFHQEVIWQRERDFASFDETDLLREHAWVTLCSGFREAVVRRVFDHISLCFCDWESAKSIVQAGDICRETALASFRNYSKLTGLLVTARHLDAVGFGTFKQAVLLDPLGTLQQLPFIGPVTSWHLAKNLGLEAAKPDRHLVRASRHFGFRDANHLCREVATEMGEQPSVVDLIVWRYLADHPNSPVLVS